MSFGLKCYLLTAANVTVKAAQWIAAGLNQTETMDGIPLGDTVGDGSGVIAVKVIQVGSGIGSGPATATSTQIASAAADTLLLAANTARKGATIYNNADKVLHLKLGSGAATTANSTIDLAAETAGLSGGYYEVPYGFTGQIRGIWEAAPTGTANVVELT